jgi:hypothetical protein
VSRARSRPARPGRLARAALACFIVGVALIFPFEYALTLTLGVLALLAFVVLGTFAIVTPDHLGARPDVEDAGPPDGRPARD